MEKRENRKKKISDQIEKK
ncbi:Protein CBG26004 [Caenorhabditis briggsae]|uniref:Protein CBG26004 n=1 Tax=Caenorhabditis briggsae TaxID=6238 RepID=B6IKV4_CAEBR|nr:Protein CBG26004 [Caenorhabditis briggsae]CAS00534.1 Protein CBG26004 [Caenorhabditis briggsae]